MELLQQILEGIWKGLWLIVEALEPVFRALAEAIFNTDIPPGGATSFTIMFLLLVAAWFISKFFFGVTKSAANQPMTVTHTTAKTPAQVVREDRVSHFKAIMGMVIILGILYLVGSSMS